MDQQGINIIGVAGNARCGKDSLARNLQVFLKREFGTLAAKESLADELKFDLASIIYNQFGINVYTMEGEEKELMRPILVAYGTAHRKSSNGKHWVQKVEEKIKNLNSDCSAVIIPDIRYCEYEEDEVQWAKNRGGIIYLEREDNEPANEYERENNAKIKKLANVRISLPNMDGDLEALNKLMMNELEKNSDEIFSFLREIS